jgi:hypothetical protein
VQDEEEETRTVVPRVAEIDAVQTDLVAIDKIINDDLMYLKATLRVMRKT